MIGFYYEHHFSSSIENIWKGKNKGSKIIQIKGQWQVPNPGNI